MTMKQGSAMKNLVFKDQDGREHSLQDHLGSWVLFYFYPKDDTPGCTREACAFRDVWEELQERNVRVFGVSAQGAESHARFREKYRLPFSLIVDEEKELAKYFGAWGKKKFMGREYMGMKRISFLIDPKGRIVHIYEKVSVNTHAQEVLQTVKTLEQQQ